MSFDSEAFISHFNGFFSANSISGVLQHFSGMCGALQIDTNNPRNFLEKCRVCLKDARLFRLKSLVQKFDRRFSSVAYSNSRGTAVENAHVLIIGAGPAGLRTSMECVFLGCRAVTVIEKRSEFSRNNIVHLWSFVIRDLIELGAKIFFPKFCTGDLDHISIKLLQLILLKISLLLGIRFYTPCEFVDLDNDKLRPIFNPTSHELSNESFDVIVGASGARCMLPGFHYAEDRRALAIGITANFKNKNTLPEQQASEISGVARQFNVQFFDELNSYSGIDIENLVYYKGDTHYFVCTARKGSLLMKGVLVNDYPETDRLLSKSNVSQYNLCNYMRELANICTAMTIPDLEYEIVGDMEDTAIFDFTSSCYAKHSSRAIIKADGRRLLLCLVGDSLRLPFWPEGTGCPRGFLSSYDTAWLIQNWFSSISPLECIALRECVYGLYSSTKPDVLYKNFTELERFHLDPQSRYRQLDLSTAHVHLPKARALIDGNIDVPDAPFSFVYNAASKPLMNGRKRNDSQRNPPGTIPDRLNKWCVARLRPYIELLPSLDKELCFFDGMALCCLLHSMRPSAIDLFAITPGPLAVETFLNAVFREFTIAPQLTAAELMSGANHNALVRLLLQLYTITSHAERAAANEERRAMDAAAKGEKLKELGRGLRQQRKHQLAVEHLLFGDKQMTLEEKKLKLKELFILGQSNATASTAGTASGNGPKMSSPTFVGQIDFEERRARVKGMFDQEGCCKATNESDVKSIEASESLREKRDVLIRKLLGSGTLRDEGEPITVAKLSGLLASSGTKRSQQHLASVYAPQAAKKLLTSLSSSCITEEQKRIAAALFETRLLGQRRQTSLDANSEVPKGPPPARLAPHLSVGDRKKQLLNSALPSAARSTRPTPDESAHIPVLEMKDRLGIACDSHATKSIDPIEKSQMPISELAKRIATSSAQSHQPPDRRPEYQIVNQDYQPCCYICDDRLYVTERMQVGQFAVHRDCFRCAICRRLLRWSSYSSVEAQVHSVKRTVFICPSHVENNEVEAYLTNISDKGRQANSQVVPGVMPTTSPKEKRTVIDPKQSEPPKSEETPQDTESEEDIFFEIEEEEQEQEEEELEGSVSSSIEELELEEVTDGENSEQDASVVSVEDVNKCSETLPIEKKLDAEKSVELRGQVKIDSWLHAQLVQQRQQKLILAKQAFLANSEPTSLSLPLSPDINSSKRATSSFIELPTDSTLATQLSANRGELEMECDSDTAEDASHSKKSAISTECDVSKLADECESHLTISSANHHADGKEHGAMRNMFSKLQRSLDASMARFTFKNRSPVPGEVTTNSSPNELGESEPVEHAGDEEDTDVPKWRKFANSILSGNWPRSRRSASSASVDNTVVLRPSKSKPRQRPDSVTEMLFGANGANTSLTQSSSNGKQIGESGEKRKNGEHYAEDAAMIEAERRRTLDAFVADEDNKLKNPSLLHDAERLIVEIDQLETERRLIDDEINELKCRASSSGKNMELPLREALHRQSDISKHISELLLKAKIIEIDADMDDLMRKYLLATQNSSRNSPSKDGQSPEHLMHQIALLASDRDVLSGMITSDDGASKVAKNQDAVIPSTQLYTSLRL